MKAFVSVDEYIASLDRFRVEITRLRAILLAAPLTETIKWGKPAYTFEGKNVVGLAAFKEHCAIWFHQGALLADVEGRFADSEELGSTAKGMRQWRIHSIEDIEPRLLQAYVKEAIALVESGRKIVPTRGKPVDIPPELADALRKSGPLRKAFEALTPGKQREYTEHIAEAKKPETKQKRLENITPMIRAGVGLHDKYRNC